MVSNMVTTWQNRMLDCVGLPKDVVAPAETINLAIIDRSYSAGRAFLNLPDLTGFIQVCQAANAALDGLQTLRTLPRFLLWQ